MTDSLSKMKQQYSPEYAPGISVQLADKILQDPILLRRLNDRIYNIFLDDMRQARDRNPGGRS
jgi:hypothetical protein